MNGILQEGLKSCMNDFLMTDQVVIVTGGARGIGLDMAKAVLEAGALVYVVDVADQCGEDISTYYRLIKACNGISDRLKYRQVNVTDQPQVRSVFREIADEHGRLDGLICAAGVNREIPFLDFDLASWNEVIDVDLTGVFITAHAAAHEMIRCQSAGRMLFVASIGSTRAIRTMNMAAYHAAKAGICGLVKSMAYELAPHNISVNYICPGITHTAMTQRQLDEAPEKKEQWEQMNCFGRLAKTAEMKCATVFFMSRASSFVHGQGMNIDGGHTIF